MAANLPPEVGAILEGLFKKTAPAQNGDWIAGYIKFDEAESHDIPISRLNIKDEDMAGLLSKSVGRYSTLQTGPLWNCSDMENACGCLAGELERYLAPYKGKTLLVCGTGNPDLAVDSIGPEAVKRIVPTLSMKSAFEKLEVLAPGVNGAERIPGSAAITRAASETGAACVLAIGSVYCTDYSRLYGSFQLTDAGMRIHHTGEELSLSTTGVPVISVGFPTVICTGDSAPDAGVPERDMLTISNIEAAVKRASLIIASAILQVAYPELDHAASMMIVNHSPL